MKYLDEILHPPLSLSVHILEGKLEILGMHNKSEEDYSLLFHISAHLQTFIAISLKTAMFCYEAL